MQEQQGEIWGAAVAAVGIGASLYGANKQAKDAAHAQDVNIAAQQDAQRGNWMNYLTTRGIAPGPNTQVGEIPGYAPGSVVNTKLPLWAKVVAPPPSQVQPSAPTGADGMRLPFLIKK